MTWQTLAQSTTPTTPTVPLPRPAGNGQGTRSPAAPSERVASEPQLEGCPFLALIVPSDEGERQAQAMENWFQACSSDEPFALELVGTKREQGFLLRASSEQQLSMLCKLLESQYPQAEIQRVAPRADPLLIDKHEHAVVGEFSLTQPSYLPLKTFNGKALAEPGADPLAAILASMEVIGSGSRMIAQLALVRAPESWLSADIRKSVEHALQPERDALATSRKNTMAVNDVAEGSKLIAVLLIVIGSILASRWYREGAQLPLTLLGATLAIALLGFIWWNLVQKKPPILAARDMDDSAVNILGSTLINLLHRAFSLQQPMSLRQRRKVFVAVDEFQNFSGSDFDKLLSEDAKYGCALLLAAQNLKRLNKIRNGLLEMVLSNCQQLCVFRVSAADAKIMVEELQEKVTIKHIISLPVLHCYARLSLPDYPLQIVSVQLTPSASWLDDTARNAIVDEIRRTSQDRNLPADEVDRRHAAHLHQFLDINAIAGRLQYEARSTRAKKRERDEANQLARDLHAAQVITGTKPPTNATPAAQSSGGAAQTPQQAQEKPPASGHAQNKPTRNHRRSRRMGKKPVGAPPPAPNTTGVNHSLDTTDTERDVSSNSYPLPGAGERSVAGGGSWGSSMRYEGYERHKRT